MNQPDSTDDHVVYIGSAIDTQGRAACAMQWGTTTALLSTETTLVTARDLMAAATHAETDIALINALSTRMKDDATAIGYLVVDVRAHRPALPGRAALRIQAVAGAKTRKPYVHIARGSLKRSLDPDEAREMALHWTEAAVAAQIDVRLRYALGEWGHIDKSDIDQLFDMMRAVQR